MKFLSKFVLLLWLLLSACGSQPLLTLEIQPNVITPNGDGKNDVAELKYSLSASAHISITLIGADGKVYNLRSDLPRTAGDYQFLLGGVVNGVVLPNGVYTVHIEAKPTEGAAQNLDKTIKIEQADTVLPDLQNFTVFPARFTPNRDGIDDRVTISYHLSKRAQVLVYLLGTDGKKYPVAERPDNAVKPGEPGVHSYDYEGGVDLGAMPPPDGTYQVVAEAVDAAGNRVVKTATLTIADGGVPRAEIVGATATFAPTSVPLGSALSFTATVGNIGTVPIRTKGPWSGTTYTSLENFNALEQIEEPGVFRVGVDFEGNSQGRAYPYRWGLGKPSDLTMIGGHPYLMPGQRVVVTGQIKIVEKTPIVSPYFWAGLLHEQVRIVNDRIHATRITIGF